MPASLLCGREQRLGFSVPQLLHPEKVLTSVPAFRGRWEEERGSCSLARAPTHGKPPCEFPSPMMASSALLLRNGSPPRVAA